jgi:hypothetical protein
MIVYLYFKDKKNCEKCEKINVSDRRPGEFVIFRMWKKRGIFSIEKHYEVFNRDTLIRF